MRKSIYICDGCGDEMDDDEKGTIYMSREGDDYDIAKHICLTCKKDAAIVMRVYQSLLTQAPKPRKPRRVRVVR